MDHWVADALHRLPTHLAQAVALHVPDGVLGQVWCLVALGADQTGVHRSHGCIMLCACSRWPARWLGWLNEQRSEEHTSELQSLMRNSYDDFCLKKTNQH